MFQSEPVYVNMVDNKAAIAVGTAANDSEDLYMQCGRGKAVIILHCVGKWESYIHCTAVTTVYLFLALIHMHPC